MAKTPRDEDEKRLKGKIQQACSGQEARGGDPQVRSLRKRLKRAQRRRRSFAARISKAAGKKHSKEESGS